jgi:hypothetical protein
MGYINKKICIKLENPAYEIGTLSHRNTVEKPPTFGIQQVGEPPAYGIHRDIVGEPLAPGIHPQKLDKVEVPLSYGIHPQPEIQLFTPRKGKQ